MHEVLNDIHFMQNSGQIKTMSLSKKKSWEPLF